MRISWIGCASALACAACGGLFGDGGDAGANDVQWGAACGQVSALASPPACSFDPDDAGSKEAANAFCSAWGQSVVEGGAAACDGVGCAFAIGLPACTPGSDGDAFCQAFFQRLSKTSRAYGKCGSNGTGLPANCFPASTCTPSNNPDFGDTCTCGASPSFCGVGKGSLCVQTSGGAACAAWCQ